MKPTQLRVRALLAFVCAFACAAAIAANDGSFTLATKANGDGTLTPTLTWTTTPAATSCAASGNAAWTGQKAGSGTVALAPVPTNQPQSYALVCTWPGDTQAMLTWTAPTQNTDDSALTDLAGYKVIYGNSPSLGSIVAIPTPSATSYKITGLTTSGTYYFGILAYTTAGAESKLSGLVTKVINATAVQWSQQTGFKVPKAPAADVPQ